MHLARLADGEDAVAALSTYQFVSASSALKSGVLSSFHGVIITGHTPSWIAKVMFGPFLYQAIIPVSFWQEQHHVGDVGDHGEHDQHDDDRPPDLPNDILSGVPDMPEVMNRHMPNGGVDRPTIMLKQMMRPK